MVRNLAENAVFSKDGFGNSSFSSPVSTSTILLDEYFVDLNNHRLPWRPRDEESGSILYRLDARPSSSNDAVQHEKGVPLPKPPERPPRMRRCVSDPVRLQRRPIFAKFWQGKNHDPRGVERLESENACSQTPSKPYFHSRQRAASISGPILVAEESTPSKRREAAAEAVVRDMVTPMTPCNTAFVLDDHEHFRPIETLQQEDLQGLPGLPLPLRRFYSGDGRTVCMGGVYPLLSPKSILKPASYSKEKNTVQRSARHRRGVDLSGDNRVLTKTESTDSSVSRSSAASSRSSAPSSPGQCAAVSFDPRITISEFADFHRKWYSDEELDRFRISAVLRAQNFLIKNPALIEEYNKPTYDPVTGALRKKALFSLAVLGAGNADAESDDDEGTRPSYCRKSSSSGDPTSPPVMDVVDQHVSSILIVDRNELVLSLLHRGIQQLFPNARIILTRSSTEAWRLFHAGVVDRRCFDIVIAEQRLQQPLSSHPGTPLGSVGKCFTSSPVRSEPERCQGGVSRSASVPSICDIAKQQRTHQQQRGITGAELLGNMRALEESMTTCSPSSSVVSEKRCPLLIGLSADISRDKAAFLGNGADLVWSKPPPRMDSELCEELVAELINKRIAQQHVMNWSTRVAC